MTDTMTIADFRIKMAERQGWNDIEVFSDIVLGTTPKRGLFLSFKEMKIPNPYHRIDHAIEAAKGLQWGVGTEVEGLETVDGPYIATVAAKGSDCTEFTGANGDTPAEALSRALCLYLFGKELIE